MEEKYINLLLKKCLSIKRSKSLFISYDVINKKFVNKLVEEAKKLGFNDIKLDEEDINIVHNKLSKLTIDEIENDEYFDKSIWNEYALKNANFLMLETEFPHLLDDIDKEKILKMTEKKKKTREEFRKREASMQLPWTIAAVANEYWAKDIFKNDNNAYDKLNKCIMKMCMVDKDDPIKEWDNYLKEQSKLSEKMNSLKIKKLQYKNSLGTDLTIELPDNVVWNSAAGDEKLDVLVNMPSYEIFTSPVYNKTEGIVYSSKPLLYGGSIIDEFYIKFKDGQVVDYNAKIGYEVLKGIIEYDSNSSYLGEVALVNYNSPISNTGLIFKTTLFDENASCHLALGDGFKEAIEDGENYSDDELLKKGINRSKQHVDFMIGTKDLEIIAQTDKGNIVLFKNGNFNI